MGLAGIYKAAELFYLTDSSQYASATRSFVKSRIRDAELIQAALNMNPVSVAPQTLTAAFVTVRKKTQLFVKAFCNYLILCLLLMFLHKLKVVSLKTINSLYFNPKI